MVVLSVLNVISAHNLDFSEVCILFPLVTLNSSSRSESMLPTCAIGITYIEEINFLEELLLVVLELTDHRA